MKKSGFSLVEVLIAVGIASILGLIVTGMMGNMFGFLSYSNAEASANNASKLIGLALQTPTVCSSALRTPAGSKVSYIPPGDLGSNKQTIGQIMFNGSTAYNVGKDVGFGASITKIAFEEINPVARGTYTVPGAAPVTYKTYAGNIALYMTAPSSSGSITRTALAPRLIPISIDVNVATNLIEQCHFTSDATQLCANLGGVYDSNTTNCNFLPVNKLLASQCTAATSSACPSMGTDPSCVPFYYVNGFNSDGTPVCLCSRSCGGAPAPMPSPYPWLPPWQGT